MKRTGLTLGAVLTTLSSGFALAQQAGDSEQTVLQEVVVTAEKRTERLQDVPVSASVVNAQQLANSNVSDVSDLNKLVPSLDLNGTINGRVPMGLRGISSVSNEAAVGVPSGVAIMIDGVPVPTDSFDGNNVEDIQAVEVLKGPQATLGGRTAAAGIINYRTFDPTDHFTGALTATGTTDSEYRGMGRVSGPIGNALEFSLSAYAAQRYYPVTNEFYDQKTGQKNWGLRAKLLWKITDDFSAKLTYHRAASKVDGFNFVYTYTTPGADLLFTPGPLTQALLLPGITPSWNNLDYKSPVSEAGHRHDDNDAQLDLTWVLGTYTLTSTTAYQHEDQEQVQDLFATAVYFFDTLVTGMPVTSDPHIFNDTQWQSEKIRQWSEELKLVSPVDQPVNFVAGLFASDTKIDEVYLRNLPPAQENLEVMPETATYDIYGRVTWNFTPSNALIVGLRYNYDVLKYQYNQIVYALGPGLVFGPYYSTSNSSYCTPGTEAPATVSNYSYSSCNSSAVVGDIAFQHHFSPDVMGYVTYARGYSPEVYNTAATLTSNAPLTPAGQTHINHFEIGAKGTYFDHHVTLNVAAFDTIYSDYQIQQFSVIPGAINPLLNLQAAGKAETRGAELDATWFPTTYTTLSFNTAYIDAVFKDYPGAACQPNAAVGVIPSNCTVNADGTVTQDMSGQRMPNAPKWKLYVDAQQRIPLSSGYEVLLDGNWAYRTSAQMLPDNNPNAILPAFGILNLQVGLRSTVGNWGVYAFCNNVFNRVYDVDVEDFWSSPWSGTSTVIAQPARDAQRYGGLRVTFNF
jgi:iron complex outermembrane receptor protein